MLTTLRRWQAATSTSAQRSEWCSLESLHSEWRETSLAIASRIKYSLCCMKCLCWEQSKPKLNEAPRSLQFPNLPYVRKGKNSL